jgi:hypothetical protein
MIRVLILALPILLALYALIDCIQTDESEVRGLPKIGWIVLIVLVTVIGPIAWLVAGRSRRGRTSRRGLPGWTGQGDGGRPSSRPLAPDDDPEFLGRLGSTARDRRLEEWEADRAPEKPPEPKDDERPDTDDGKAPR